MSQQIPWLEKYRANTLSDLYLPVKIADIFNGFIRDKNVPHLIIYGSPGTGKTSAINSLLRDLMPCKGQRQLQILSLNASVERGIKTIRSKVKSFANTSVEVDPGMFPLKIIVMDEADTLTDESQFAMRRIIEDYSVSTRFILIGNYLHQIIEPLKSRCSMISFPMMNDKNRRQLIDKICKSENIVLTKSETDAIVVETDVRKLINLLSRINTNTVVKELGNPAYSDYSDGTWNRKLSEIHDIVISDKK